MNCRAAVCETFLANSEVSPVARLVAVALITTPGGRTEANSKSKSVSTFPRRRGHLERSKASLTLAEAGRIGHDVGEELDEERGGDGTPDRPVNVRDSSR